MALPPGREFAGAPSPGVASDTVRHFSRRLPGVYSVLPVLAVLAPVALCLGAPAAGAGTLDDALRARCTPDSRLADSVTAAMRPADHLDAAALRRLAEGAGLPAAAVHAIVVRGPDEATRAAEVTRWLDARRLSPGARCAAAVAGDLVAVALVPHSAEVSPLDPAATPGSSRDYVFSLPEGTRAPSLVIALPSGGVDRMPVALDGPTTVRFTDHGEYTLQLVVATDAGPTPLATWHVQVGAPQAAQPAPRTVSNPRDVLAAVNALRAQAGLAVLRADPLLTRVATEYAARLAARSEVAHGASAGDSPVARLAEAHVTAERVAENVARAPSLAAAHARLAASPSHRANLMDRYVDAAGVGTATAGDDVYLVELMATHPGLEPLATVGR